MIYCLEDDDSSRELMIYTLKTAGFEALGFNQSLPFWDAMKKALPDLIILDIMLPGEDGLSVLKRLRNSVTTEDIPVLMETAKGTEFDKVVGLDTGADDYIAKPYGMMELVSRVKALLRRAGHRKTKTVLKLGGISMSTAEHTVTVNGKEVELTLKEYDLLHLFLKNPGKAFTREMLLSLVWNDNFVGETRTVDVHVGTLRSKLGPEGDRIKTVRGVGYRMEALDDK